jgi:hypothetical protein
MVGVGKFSGGEPEISDEAPRVVHTGEIKDGSQNDRVLRNERIQMQDTGIGRASDPAPVYPYKEDIGVKSAGGKKQGALKPKEKK